MTWIFNSVVIKLNSVEKVVGYFNILTENLTEKSTKIKKYLLLPILSAWGGAGQDSAPPPPSLLLYAPSLRAVAGQTLRPL
jgi:hypothetical protein